ncbi:MAG: transporter substrate-binding domain-containing protein [Burkholderiales bacterium]|nr:transporter substrate-binding domain-containing protein [Burkholderiales bacterium]
MLRSLLLFFLLFSAFAHAERVVRLGTADVAPYGLMKPDGQADGVFLQLGNLIATRAGLPHENGLYPPARLYAMLQRHELDLAISSRSLDRDIGLVNLGKVGQMEGRIVYRDTLNIDPHGLADFSPYLIGRIGATCPPLARANMRLYDLSDYDQGYRMLMAGHLDALCGDSGGLSSAIRHIVGDKPVPLKSFTFLTTDVWVYANPQLPAAERKKLHDAIEAMQAGGEIERFLAQQLPSLILTGRGGK